MTDDQNQRERLVRLADSLLAEGKSEDEVRAAVAAEMQKPRLPAPAPVDRSDQTIRNPGAGPDPAMRMVRGLAGLAVGGGVGGAAFGGTAKILGPKALSTVLGRATASAVGSMAGGSAGRGVEAAVSGRNPLPEMKPSVFDAAIGGGASLVGDAVVGIKDKVQAWRAGRTPAARSAKELAKAATTGKTDIQKAIQGAPDDATLLDVGGADVRDVGATAMSVPSIGRTDLIQKMEGRALGREERVRAAFDEATGVGRFDPFMTKREIDEALRPAIKAEYARAMKKGKRLNDEQLSEMLFGDNTTDDLKEAVSHARKAFRNQKKSLPKEPHLAEWPEGGGTDVPNLDFADRAKRYLDAKARKAIKTDDLTGLMQVNMSRRALVKRLDELVPGYAEARASDHARRMYHEATQLGRKITNGTIDPRQAKDLLQQLIPERAAPDVAKTAEEYFRRGVVDGIRRGMDKGADGAQALKRLAGSEWRQEIANLAIPDEGRRVAFRKALDAEEAMVPAEVTARARGSHAIETPDSYGPATPWAVKELFSGNPALFAAQTGGQALRDLQTKAFKRSAEQIVKDLGITVKKGGKITPEAEELLRRIRGTNPTPTRDMAQRALRTAQVTGALGGVR